MTTQTYLTPACPVCGLRSSMELDPEKYERWQTGTRAYRIWPEMSTWERELLMTGTHPQCWPKLFDAIDGDEEEEEESNGSY